MVAPKSTTAASAKKRTAVEPRRSGTSRKTAAARAAPAARADTADPLATYRAKRRFERTPEPQAVRAAPGKALSFVVQKHAARTLHYDFRLEIDGVMRSWAVPKGPSFDPKVKRMAVQTEDHPVSYNSFEGTIPAGEYGAGEVIVWDRGTWTPLEDPHQGFARGKLAFTLDGEKLQGAWELIRTGKQDPKRPPSWLLFKKHDSYERPAGEYDVVAALPDSVLHKGKKTARKTSSATSRAAPRSSARSAATADAAGIRVTHPERVVDASTGITKLDLVRYYESVAEFILPHLQGRPCSLVRAPDGLKGELFFQKHLDRIRIAGVRQLDPELWPGHAALIEVASIEALAACAQMNVVEFHTWNAPVRNLDKPDRVVFDIDPGEGVAWPQVREAAALTRSFLHDLGLDAWLKTSGGKGLHVVVPLVARQPWQQVRAFAQAAVEHLARVVPDRFVAKSGPRNRVGRIFIDYLRNTYGATTAAAYSARARPGLGVSMPVPWDALDTLKAGDEWTVRTARDHLSVQRADPWEGYATCRQTLAQAVKTLGVK